MDVLKKSNNVIFKYLKYIFQRLKEEIIILHQTFQDTNIFTYFILVRRIIILIILILQ